MVKNRQGTRAFVAFLVTWSFVILTATGIVLYVVPHGRVATWTFWSLAGLDKDGWADVHLLFGAVFIVAGALHLYFNWKPFTGYLAQRVRGHLALKRELATSLAATLLLALGAVFAVPPIGWLFDLNDAAKSAWGRAPGHEPPYPRAETTPLSVLAKRLGLELESMRSALAEAGARVDDPAVSLEALARAQGTTPAALFALLPQPRPSDSPPADAPADPMEIEARLAGTGIGGKTLAQVAEANGLHPSRGLERLAAVGISARADETLKTIAEHSGSRPIEIAKTLLLEGYRPERKE